MPLASDRQMPICLVNLHMLRITADLFQLKIQLDRARSNVWSHLLLLHVNIKHRALPRG